MSNIIAIVGRPNVGKSTLFNRIVKQREAIVDSVSGVTRDRHYGKGDWNGKEFSLIDTGGYVVGSDDIFELEIDKQVELAIDEADLILFMVDVETGVTSMDTDIANMLRKIDKPVYLVINKVDNSSRINDASEFFELGFDKYYPIASINGFGSGDLLDAVVKDFSEDVDLSDNLPKFAVVGRPNAGKSSLLKVLTGHQAYIKNQLFATLDTTTKKTEIGGDTEVLISDTVGFLRNLPHDLIASFRSTLSDIQESDLIIKVIDISSTDIDGHISTIDDTLKFLNCNDKKTLIVFNKIDIER